MDVELAAETKRFNQLKRGAWDAQDMDLFEFYAHIEFELKRLRAVGRVVGKLYEKGASDEQWSALFEALFDSGMLDTTANEEEAHG